MAILLYCWDMENCIFCKIVKGEAPSSKVTENDLALAFESIAPAAEHHVIVIPKEHISTFTDLEEHHKESLMAMAKLAQEVIAKRKIDGAYKLVMNGGQYQSVKHIHLHVLGGKFKKELERDVVNKT